MSTVFFGVKNRFFTFSHVIGRAEYSGPGFRTPVDLALAPENIIYVLNRASERRPDGNHVTVCTFDERYITEFGSSGRYGVATGQFVWPTSIVLDSKQNVYVADEWLNEVSVFTKDGEFLHKWGKEGSGPGNLDRPSGLAISNDETIYVVDSRNHRVQTFTLNGEYAGQFGSFGSGPGQLNMPWGISLDRDGLIYVADWRNDRIQVFTPDGKHQATLGQSGNRIGEFNRPAGVAVDQDGDIYVADWKNNRVQVFTRDGRFITQLRGDAGLSTWGKEKLLANPDMIRQRSLVPDHTPERLLWNPRAVKVDHQGRIAILDTTRFRIQVYQKHKTPVLF